MMTHFLQIENRIDRSVLWLSEIFTRDYLESALKENKPVKPVK